MKHTFWHLLGCLLPIAVIFLLPLFGISGGTLLFIFIILMFGCHLFMMRGHGHSHDSHHATNGDQEHEHH